MRLNVKCFFGAVLFAVVTAGLFFAASAQTYTGESSNRVTINMGETPWKFMKGDFYTGTPNARDATYNDNTWSNVGIPHSFNAKDTWLNVGKGVDGTNTYKGTAWYRKHFTLDAAYTGRKIEVEFQGVNVGCAVYVNGKIKSSISAVTQQEATHVSGHLPFVVDITGDVKFGEENVIAVRVSNNGGFYTGPGIGTAWAHAANCGGIHRPVFMHITDKVHVPVNVYSNVRRWGTYVGATAATEASATVRMQTNVYNDDTQGKTVTVITRIVDAQTKAVVATQTSTPQTIGGNSNYVFDQTATIANPRLWYPNNSIHGKPYMHKVYHIVQVGGQTVDVFTTPLGIRVITWDNDFGYVNGKKHIFWGFGCRYEYPGFGSAVPEEQQWRDIKLIAECGGSMLRPGHVPIATATVEACDAYGVCLFENSMDTEWAIKGEPTLTYKDEYHRDCMIRDRNHPSLVLWELTNGSYSGGFVQPAGWIKRMVDTAKKYDFIAPRASTPRDSTDYWPTTPGELVLATNTPYRRKTTRMPVWGSETWPIANPRWGYNYEVQFVDRFILEVTNVLRTKGLGTTHWLFMECSGENYKGYLDASITDVQRKTLGCSAVDQNRIPKFMFNVYKKAVWVPFSIQPGVALQSHWNYSTGNRTVTAYSNCPSVELFVNSVSKGVQTPLNDTTRKFEWTNVAWESGTLRAVGRNASGSPVCSDERKTAGAPSKIVLTVEPAIIRPDNGETFRIRANGTDAAFILATIVDAQGNWCPLASNNITFSVSGQGTYIGSSNFIADISKGPFYHAPGDSELAAEGGMMKIGVRATFTPGSFTVGATAAGLTAAAPVSVTTTDLSTGIRPLAATLPHEALGVRSRTFKIMGTAFTVPAEFAGKAVSIKIYNLSGKLLRSEELVKTKRVSLAKYGIATQGMYIVRCREFGPKNQTR